MLKPNPISEALPEILSTQLAEYVHDPRLIAAIQYVRDELVEARAYTLLDTHVEASVYNATLMSHLYGQLEFADLILRALSPAPKQAAEDAKPKQEPESLRF